MKLGEAYVELRGDNSKLVGALSGAHGLVTSGAGKLGRAFSAAFTAPFRLVSQHLMGALGVTALLGKSVKDYAEFEKDMALVNTMLDSKTGAMLGGMGDRIKELSVKYGQGTHTLVMGLYEILSSLIPASKAMNLLEVSTRAAIGGMTESATATNAIVSILSGYTLSADRAAHVSDLMFKAVQRGRGTYGEWAQSIGEVASMAALAGMSLEEMMAVLATVSRKFPINEAVTSLAMFLHALIEPQDDAAQAAKELGVDFGMERFQAEGLVAILQDLENATIGQASSLAGRVRGFRALGAILTDETKGVEDLKEMMNAGGAATEAYDKVQGTTTERLRRLKARVDELSLAVGERLVTAFDDASARIGPALEDAGKQFRALWNTVKELMPDLGDTLNLDFAGMIEAGIRAVPRFVASLITGLMQVYETITDLIDALTAQWSATVAAVKVMWTGSFPEIGAALGEALTSAITEALDALEKRFAGSFLGRVLAGTEATVAGIEGVFTTIGEAGIAVQEFLSGLTRPPANWRGTPTGAGPVPVPATPFSELATVVEPSLYERATEAYRAEIEKLKKENPKLAESWSEAFGKALQDAMRNAIKPETRPFAELLARLFFKIPASVRGRIGQFFDLMQKQYLAEQPPTKGRYLKDGPADPEIQKERAKREAELRSNIAEKVFAPRATFGVPMGMMRFPFALTGGGKTQEAWLAKIAQNTRETYMAIDKKGGLAP